MEDFRHLRRRTYSRQSVHLFCFRSARSQGTQNFILIRYFPLFLFLNNSFTRPLSVENVVPNRWWYTPAMHIPTESPIKKRKLLKEAPIDFYFQLIG